MFAELKRKPFIPITATAVLESPQVTIPISDTEDTAALAIDLSVKQKDDPVDSGKCLENSDPPSALDENQIVISPSTTEKIGSSSVSSEVDMESYKQQAVDSNTPGSGLITYVSTDSSSISDSLLSPNPLVKSTSRTTKVMEHGDSILGLNNIQTVHGNQTLQTGNDSSCVKGTNIINTNDIDDAPGMNIGDNIVSGLTNSTPEP